MEKKRERSDFGGNEYGRLSHTAVHLLELLQRDTHLKN